MAITYLEIVLRLLLSVLLGGLVGFERESHNRPAGFRTHILVCTGSALVMLVSSYSFVDQLGVGFEADPGRIAAGVVTGIGFLGAGTIMQQRGSIRGLTTAASIWVVSGIGLAVGVGFYFGAVLTTVLVLLSLFLLGRIEKSFFAKRRLRTLIITALVQPGLLGVIGLILGEMMINIRKINLGDPEPTGNGSGHSEKIVLELLLEMPLDVNLGTLFRRLYDVSSVEEINWQGESVVRSFN